MLTDNPELGLAPRRHLPAILGKNSDADQTLSWAAPSEYPLSHVLCQHQALHHTCLFAATDILVSAFPVFPILPPHLECPQTSLVPQTPGGARSTPAASGLQGGGKTGRNSAHRPADQSSTSSPGSQKPGSPPENPHLPGSERHRGQKGGHRCLNPAPGAQGSGLAAGGTS